MMTTPSFPTTTYDLAIVGAGVVGLAHAYLAASAGLRVVVIERDGAANGASVRNFGFITVTGQKRGEFYQLARRSRAIWQTVIAELGLRAEHEGLYMCVRRPESEAILDAFLRTEMGEGCRLLAPSELPIPLSLDVRRVLHSPHEVRLESRDVIPQVAENLRRRLGVDFLYHCTALDVSHGQIATSLGTVRARSVVVCQGDNLSGVFASRLPSFGVSRCKLQMLRLASPGYRLPGSIMSDLGLVRYLGYSELDEAAALKIRLESEQPQHLKAGVHLIVVQGTDGSLVVGDSHSYDHTPDPFGLEAIDDLILDEYRQVLGAPPPVLERWIGTYAVSDQQLYFIDTPDTDVRHVVVTCGAGASTAFGIAEKTLSSLGVELHATIVG
ncbi:FAD dependent oxidoreductase family protein [Asticcacaulis biprosthecium C19]|uniref:FAD dependent oxidoreductase family protein n=1 Tax=Asticcacaulis biprosthecium C19 TaxID=715226 RepID=F4QSS1_9CAUL|nr:TIGR03364 family FAD-dependent oxidoreductase [Asticcacaulis biprosthecium]EGF89791.1 FAD dependent oxidoreductase family protein [Asticcacaulis biprosthecium C19]